MCTVFFLLSYRSTVTFDYFFRSLLRMWLLLEKRNNLEGTVSMEWDFFLWVVSCLFLLLVWAIACVLIRTPVAIAPGYFYLYQRYLNLSGLLLWAGKVSRARVRPDCFSTKYWYFFLLLLHQIKTKCVPPVRPAQTKSYDDDDDVSAIAKAAGV